MQGSKLKTSILGRTGLEVSRFAAGGHFTDGPSSHDSIPRRIRELNHMLDLGVNYLDVQWQPEEEAVAAVMKARRDEFIVSWPLHGATRLGGMLTERYILDYCHERQDAYGIDHVDILLWVGLELYRETEHHVMEVMRSAFSRLKAEGFCDFLGFSCHHSAAMAKHAITDFDEFDVMMVPYCAIHREEVQEETEIGLFRAAREKGIGVAAMKPFGGSSGFFNQVWSGSVRHPETDRWIHSGRPYQAAMKWALKNDEVDCVVAGMHSVSQIDQLYQAACDPYTGEDEEILETMRRVMEATNLEVTRFNLYTHRK